MRQIFSVPILLSVLLLGSAELYSQVIHPGDVNNNGVVNGVDILYWSLVKGDTGAVRINGSDAFQPQIINQLWQSTFSNGIDHAYADCNGDGIVDELDLNNAIIRHTNKNHNSGTGIPDPFQNGQQGVDPIALIEPEVTSVKEGEQFRVNVTIEGVNGADIQNFYGITMSLFYMPRFVKGGWSFNYSTPLWMGNTNEVVQFMYSDPAKLGVSQLTFARTDKTSIDGHGIVGSFNIIIEDFVVGLVDKDTLEIEVKNIMMIDQDFNTTPVAGSIAKIEILKNTNAVQSPSLENKVLLFPNPAENHFYIKKLNEIKIDEILFHSQYGQFFGVRILEQDNEEIHLQINNPNMPAGLYFLKMKTTNGQWIQKKLFVL